MAVQLTYTGTPFADQIRQQGFRPGGILSVAPGKIFSTTNPAFASTYGTPINLATSTRAFSLPSFNFSSGVSGKEVIQSPKAATKGMRVAEMAERLKGVSPTANKLLSGKTVSGLGGGVAAPGILRSLFSLPMAAVTAGPQVISSLMAPKTEAGFDYMKDFDKGAITSIADAENAFDFEQFGTGIMAADNAAIQRATSIDPNVVAAIDAQTADELAQLPIDEVQSRGILDLLKSGAGKVRDTFLQGMGAQGGLNIGARLGMMVNPALAIPAALAGAFFGARGIREATPGEKGIQSLYGGQNRIGEGTTFIDPITGEEVGSEMAGYNISSMFGQGLPAAIDKRLATIEKTRQRKGQLSQVLQDRKEALEKERAAAKAAELAAIRDAARAQGFQGDTRTDSETSFADTQSYGGGGTMGDMGADTFT